MKAVSRAELIEYARSYLRKHDIIQGYFPQLAMSEQSSEWWCMLWYCVRKIDTLVDDISNHNHASPDDVLISLQERDIYFKQSLYFFIEETKDIVPRQLLTGMYNTPWLEKNNFTLEQAPSCEQYLALIDQKTGIPLMICAALNGLDTELVLVQRLVVSAGYTVQLMDDLLDLHHDLANDRLFITQEEFAILGIEPDELLANIDRIVQLRTKWFMEVSFCAYETAHLIRDNSFALIVRSWIEGAWRLVSVGKSVPVSPQIGRNMHDMAHYLGVTSIPFDFLPGSELLKYRIMRRLLVAFLKHYQVFTYREAKLLSESFDVDISCLYNPDSFKTPFYMDEGASSDTRKIIKWDESLGMLTMRRELFHIMRLAFEDEATKAVKGLNGNRDASTNVETLIDLINLHHAIDSDWIAISHRVTTGMLPKSLTGLQKAVDLGFDTLSIIRNHQTMYQREVVNWAVDQSTNDELQSAHRPKLQTKNI